ncbi:MAG TPA: hypothetical protein VGQ95_03685 [Chthoniobacterales bacterium]|nr:hypothetical protein [Chthoniobacterales bacterium]
MRSPPLIIAILFFSVAAFAGEIREFDIKTIERLGNELMRVCQQSDRGATNPVRKRAKQTAVAALKGKLFDIRYDYVVLDDPDGSGFLVYALGQGSKPGDTVVHGHFRVTVSADGGKAERVDALSRSVDIDSKDSPKVGDYKKWGFATNQIVGTRPVETLVYASNHMKMPIAVATPPNGQVWFIENGKIRKSDR